MTHYEYKFFSMIPHSPQFFISSAPPSPHPLFNQNGYILKILRTLFLVVFLLRVRSFSGPEFLNLGIIDILDWIILFCGSFSVYYKMCSCNPSLMLSSRCDNQKYILCQMYLQRQNHPRWRIAVLGDIIVHSFSMT